MARVSVSIAKWDQYVISIQCPWSLEEVTKGGGGHTIVNYLMDIGKIDIYIITLTVFNFL